MIVRIPLLLFAFFLSCAGGPNQGPKANAEVAPNNFTYKTLSNGEKERLAAEIRAKYEKLLGRSFSGEIVVAKNGEIVFED